MPAYDCRLATNGQRRLEINLVYPLDPNRRWTSYRLDLYLFTPAQLDLNEANYGVAGVTRDLRSYTRFMPATLPLAKLADPNCEPSPLTRIKQRLATMTAARDLDEGRLLYELRTLVNIYHAEVRNTRHLLRQNLARSAQTADFDGRLYTLFTDIDRVLVELRALHQTFLDPRVSDVLREALRWADEAMSLNTEKETFKFYELAQKRPELASTAAWLKARLGRETEYRAGMNYPARIDPADPVSGEFYVYRESLLKKWAQSALYMTQQPSKLPQRIVHIAAGTAAAVAMAFAVGATILADRLFASYSLPWAILIVVAYIFKDRLKEILRGLLMAIMPGLVADRRQRLVDPATGQSVGRSSFRVRFVAPASLPGQVVQLRNQNANPLRRVLPPENVIHLHKEVRLDSRRLLKRHQRLEAVAEILRLRLDQWLANMDDPVNRLRCLRGGESVQVEANRVYHGNLVMRLYQDNQRDQAGLFRGRLILNRNGIVRVENLERLGETPTGN